MSWIQNPPWPTNTNRLPCIAAGFSQQNTVPNRQTNTISSGPSASINDSGGGSTDPSTNGILTATLCVSASDPDQIIVTINFIPGTNDIGKTYRLFNDKISIDSYYCAAVSGMPTEFSVYDLAPIQWSTIIWGYNLTNWTSATNMTASISFCESLYYQQSSRIVYNIQVEFQKGPSLSVNGIEILENGKVVIIFNSPENGNCSCFSTCLPSSGIQLICDGKQTSVVGNVPEGSNSPYIFRFTLVDSNNHTNEISIPTIAHIEPMCPLLSLESVKPIRNVKIAIPRMSTSFSSLNNYVTHYQIERYSRVRENKNLICDWTSLNDLSNSEIFYDTILYDYTEYGYRIRYLGPYKDVSQWSEWVTIYVHKNTENMNTNNANYSQ